MPEEEVVYRNGTELVSDLKTGRVIEYSMMIARLGEDHQIRIQRRSKKGFCTISVYRLHNSSISESLFQDIMSSFTLCVLDELITTQGVQLVLPL